MTATPDPMHERFREIAAERLRAINEGIMKLEAGDGDGATVDEVMREIHTLKGESRMLGLGAMNRVSHRTEDLLLFAKRSERLGDAAWLEHVYAGLDLLSELVGELGEDAPGVEDSRARAFGDRAESVLGDVGESPASVTASRTSEVPTPVSGDAEKAKAPAPAEEKTGASDDGPSQRVSRALVDEITRTSGELGVLQAHMRQFADEARSVLERYREARTARLSVEVLEDLAAQLDGVLRAMYETGFDASIRQQNLQAAVERMRLAPVSRLFGRYPRMVRDLAQELGKEARLVIEGEAVGADQQVLDLLADPLVHLIRNAVDHGLEPPETREAAGKPRRGTVRLIARQAGRFVEILVNDDGRGIDASRVAEAAVRRGLLSEADVGRMTERELLEQLFRPAFSTRTTVSDVSGRGVGLDVVKTAIEDLGGSITIEGRVGVGTSFILKLPVSIALVDALVLDLEHALYAIPSAYVEHIFELEDGAIETTAGRDVLPLDDGVRIPVLELVELLDLPSVDLPADELVRVVVVAENQRRVALRVPALVGELALVQEALDPFLKGLRVVTGTAMLDGGRRVTLLNVVQLLDLVRETQRTGARAVTEAPRSGAPGGRRVLVIEDSDLTRSMLVSALEAGGWDVAEAVNGRAGLDAFRREVPDLVITDLDMPLVDGFDVIRTIRGGRDGSKVPIAVFSTRDDDASKQAAADAGADVYIVKSTFVAEDALAVFERLLEQSESGGA